MVSLEVPAVKSLPSERFKSAVLVPLELRMVKEEVPDCWISRVVEPPVKGTLVSATVKSLKVLAPLNV